MIRLPALRVVPLEEMVAHEGVDPMRVDRLLTRIEAEGVQTNPLVCTRDPKGRVVLLDGASRRAAMRRLDLLYGVTQMVDSETVAVGTWHHVVRHSPPGSVVLRIETHRDLWPGGGTGYPRVHTPDGADYLITGQGISRNATLAALVGCYLGEWRVERVDEPDVETVQWRYPDWSALVEFPNLSMADIMEAAVRPDPLPAGITRCVVPERALRVNVELSLLRGPTSLQEKQQLLDRLIEERARAGRIRRYQETVVILDD